MFEKETVHSPKEKEVSSTWGKKGGNRGQKKVHLPSLKKKTTSTINKKN